MWDFTEDQITFFMIRHGATSANEEHRYLGKTDQDLSLKGVRSLEKKRKEGIYPKIDLLFTSPMKRCLKTAEILYPFQDPVIIPEWEEIDFGAFEGKTYEELKEDDRYQAWIDSDGALPFPFGESREVFISRCESGLYTMLSYLKESFLEECSQKDKKQEKNVGLIIHGGTIMALLRSFYGGGYFDHQAANGLGYSCRLACKGEKIRLEALERLGEKM